MASRFILSGSRCRGSGRVGGIRCRWCGLRRWWGGTGRGSGATGRGRVDADAVGPRSGAPRSDSADQPRQSSLGCAEDPRRAAEAGPDGIAGDGLEVHGPAAAAAVAGVARSEEHTSELQSHSDLVCRLLLEKKKKKQTAKPKYR